MVRRRYIVFREAETHWTVVKENARFTHYNHFLRSMCVQNANPRALFRRLYVSIDQCYDIKRQSKSLRPIVDLQSNLNSLNTDGSFLMTNSTSLLSPNEILPVAQEKKMFRATFLFYHEIVCCVHSLESHHRGDSNEYAHHTIIE